ncbi:MAG: molybdopterin-synthase adenylyltransferase MoeB [Verrucomicrobiales bacterium]|jgi:adenylyltransferase/sulfurtransferase|nr:molybdopterin-synthase adenylyltransferase MoeB [Verrucomicrobiales bacterium]
MSHIPEIAQRAANVELTNEEIKRYSRHLIMPEVTIEGQKRLKAAKVLVVGTGGLGSPLLAYLAAAGVGTIGIVDFDTVDYSNLQRQILHKTSSIGKPKVQSAAEAMKDINPHIEVKTYNMALRAENAMELAKEYDIIVDGTDNFATRYLTNDVCVLLGKPNVYGSIFRFDGQVTVFWAEKGPCYRCLYPEPPDPGLVPTCAEGGVLGVLPGVVGTMQAIETVKLIVGIGDLAVGRLILFDALKMKMRELKIRKDPTCPICGPNATIKELVDYDQFCGTAPVDAPVKKLLAIPEIAPKELQSKLANGEKIVVLDVREPHEFKICAVPTAKLIPVGDLPKRIHELDSADDIVIYCKGEIRTGQAFRILQQAGFKKLKALEGGIEGWAEDVDPSMPTY